MWSPQQNLTFLRFLSNFVKGIRKSPTLLIVSCVNPVIEFINVVLKRNIFVFKIQF